MCPRSVLLNYWFEPTKTGMESANQVMTSG